MNIKINQDETEISLTIPSFRIKINGIEMDVPHNIFLLNNITKNKLTGIHYSLSLIEEYMSVLEKYFQKTWFSFDGKNYFNSSNVAQIILGEEKDLVIKNPEWSEDGRLIYYSNIYSDIKEKKPEPQLLLEKKEVKLKSLDKLSELKRMMLK